MPIRARTKPRLLLAGTPTGLRVLRLIFEGEAELLSAETLPQATRLLAADPDLIVCTLRFDESRMFELLRLVRTYERNRLTPVVCMLSGPTALSDVAIEGLDHAVKAMLANAFLNLTKFPDDREGNARVRRIIDYLILIDGDIHGGFKTVHADGH